MTLFIEKALLRAVEAICLALLVTLTLSVVYSTTMRYLGASPSWYDEIASVLLAWLTYFGAVYATFHRQHLGFAGLVLALPTAFGVIVFIVGEILVIGFFAVVAWYGYRILPVAGFDALLSLPWLSLDIVQSVVPITSGLIILVTLLTFPRALASVRAGVDHEHSEIEAAIAEAEAEAAGLAQSGKGAGR